MANSQAPFLPNKWNGSLPPPRNHSEERSTNPTSLAQGIGNGTNSLRPEGNIWSTTPHSASVTRESSRNRELSQYPSTSRDAMDGRKGSASLIASSEVEPSARHSRPSTWRDLPAMHMRSSDMRSGTSPPRRGSSQLPQGSAMVNNMQPFPQYPSQSRVSLSAIGSRSANGSYSAASGSTGAQLLETMNGFNPFNRSSEDSGRQTEWTDSGSVHSPTDERRAITEYFGSGSSTAASRNGSLPGSRQSNDPGPFATSDSFPQFGHAGAPNRGHNPSFSSQSSSRMHSDRQPSQSSDIANLVEDLHLRNGSDFVTTALFNQTTSYPQQTASGPSFRRQPRHEMSRNYNGAQINGGTSTPDGWPNGQSDLLIGPLSAPRSRDRGGLTPNGIDYRQNPYASTGGTPPSYDPLYTHDQQMRPPITDAGILDNRLQRLEQLQQQDQQRFRQQPYPSILPYRQFSPYANQYALANGLSVPPVPPVPSNIPLNPAIPTFFQPPGIIPGMESSRVPNNEATSIQSAVLNEFKLTQKTRRWELKDIKGHFVEFSGDQAGSRYIQTMLRDANSDEKQMIFDEILPNAMQLIQDVFGNYVIQKFFEHGDQTQKKILGSKMESSVVTLSGSTYGCRVVQKALEHVLVDQQIRLAQKLEKDVLRLVKDQNGNHVIQKAIEQVPHDHIGFIFDAFRGQICTLANHQYGCRVIQRILEYSEKPSELYSSVVQELHQSMATLISDQFGNYVAQALLKDGLPDDKSKAINVVRNNFIGYSKHKFASNVVEKCLEYGTYEQCRLLMMKTLEQTDTRESNLLQMIKDPFANYVLQKIMDKMKGQEYHHLIDAIGPELLKAKKAGCMGKQIAAIEKKMPLSMMRNGHYDHNEVASSESASGGAPMSPSA